MTEDYLETPEDIVKWGFEPNVVVFERESLIQFLNHPDVRSKLKIKKIGQILPEDIDLSANEDGTYTLSDINEVQK